MVLQALKNMETGIKQEWGLLPEKIKRVNQYIIGGIFDAGYTIYLRWNDRACARRT